MKILIVTDAYREVVVAFDEIGKQLQDMGHEVVYLKNESMWHVGKRIKEINPDAIHIATQGTLGLMAQRYCNKKGLQFTTSYLMDLPEYFKSRFPLISLRLGYKYLQWAQKGSRAILVATESLRIELRARYFKRTVVWFCEDSWNKRAKMFLSALVQLR